MKYQFNRDELGTIWYRDCIEVEAENYEDAKKKILELEESGEWTEHTIYTESMFDTWNPTFVKNNNGFATIEIEDPDTNKIIWKNGE